MFVWLGSWINPPVLPSLSIVTLIFFLLFISNALTMSTPEGEKPAMFATDSDKPTSVERIEDINQPALNNLDYDEEFTPAEQRKIIHRVDRRLVTMTGLAYCISLMDRTNVSAAAIAG